MKTVWLGLGLALALVPACTSDDTNNTSSSGTSGAPSAATVTVSANKFEPQTVTIKVGQAVTWKWTTGGGTHNVVGGTSCAADTGPNKFRSGDPQSGGSFEKKFDTAGTFDYFCEPHCNVGMTGKVVVTP